MKITKITKITKIIVLTSSDKQKWAGKTPAHAYKLLSAAYFLAKICSSVGESIGWMI